MKILKTLLFGSALLGMVSVHSGCAVAESSVEGVGQQFEQGLTGRGQIVPNDPTRDSFGPEFQ